MAKESVVKVIINWVDNSKKALNSATKSVSKFAKANKTTFKKMAAVWTVAFAAVVAFGSKMVKLANNQIEQEKKLAVVLRQRTKATDDQIESIKNLAKEQQKLWILWDEIQLAWAQQLATFVKSTKSVENLLPAMNNLVAQQKWVKATQEDMINIANLMGKALDGQVWALSRVGISFSDAQAEILKTGNEMERSAILAEVITWNVWEMNKALAQTTFAGKMTQLKNNLWDVWETIGKALIPMLDLLVDKIVPVVTKFATWAEENPKLIRNILVIAGAVAWLVAVVGLLWLALPGLITGIAALNTVLLANPFWLVLVAIVAVTTAMRKLADMTQTTTEKMESYRQELSDLDEQYSNWEITLGDYLKKTAEVRDLMNSAADAATTFGWTLKDNLFDMLNTIARPIQSTIDLINQLRKAFGLASTLSTGDTDLSKVTGSARWGGLFAGNAGGWVTASPTEFQTNITLQWWVNVSDPADAEAFMEKIWGFVKDTIKNSYKTASLWNT